jgi:hypothetical protein
MGKDGSTTHKRVESACGKVCAVWCVHGTSAVPRLVPRACCAVLHAVLCCAQSCAPCCALCRACCVNERVPHLADEDVGVAVVALLRQLRSVGRDRVGHGSLDLLGSDLRAARAFARVWSILQSVGRLCVRVRVCVRVCV